MPCLDYKNNLELLLKMFVLILYENRSHFPCFGSLPRVYELLCTVLDLEIFSFLECRLIQNNDCNL